MKKITIISLSSLLGVFSLLLPLIQPAVLAVSTNYPNQYLQPQNITATDDLLTKADQEVTKIINAGHLAPLRSLYGESIVHYYYYKPSDTIYTLSLLYPYLSTTKKTALKAYLASELQTYPLWYQNPANWNAPILPGGIGTSRTGLTLPSGMESTETSSQYGVVTQLPNLFGLYALWLYAQNTNDWTYINNNWTSIKNYYTSYKGDSAKFYSGIAGAIGMKRLALGKTPSDPTTAVSVQTDIDTGFTNGSSLSQFGQIADNAYTQAIFAGNSSFVFPEIYRGFQFLDITPEIGRFINDNPTLKSDVIGSIPSRLPYSLGQAEYEYIDWYIAHGPLFTRYYGEGSGLPIDARAMIFPLHAWVVKDSPAKLRSFLDVPAVPIGDYYYIQNLVRTIEASGTECWEDITTTAQECPGPLFSTSSPSPLATPTPAKTGDIDGNGKVDIFDYNILLTNFGKIGMGTQGDLDGSGKVDIFDYNTLLTNFGK